VEGSAIGLPETPDWADREGVGRRVLHTIKPVASKIVVRSVAFLQVCTSTE